MHRFGPCGLLSASSHPSASSIFPQYMTLTLQRFSHFTEHFFLTMKRSPDSLEMAAIPVGHQWTTAFSSNTKSSYNYSQDNSCIKHRTFRFSGIKLMT